MVGLEVGTQGNYLESVFCFVFHCKLKEASDQRIVSRQASAIFFSLAFCILFFGPNLSESMEKVIEVPPAANLWLCSSVFRWGYTFLEIFNCNFIH